MNDDGNVEYKLKKYSKMNWWLNRQAPHCQLNICAVVSTSNF